MTLPHIKLPDLSIYYESAGDGEPVLWIAGLGSDHSVWTSHVDFFRQAYRCVTFDNRDAGQSDRASGNYTIRDMADDAKNLMDALGIASAHVVGLSMGGAIAQELAISYPQRVRTLALVCTYTRGDPRGTEIMNSWMLMRERFSSQEYYRAILPWLFSHQEYLMPGLVENYLKTAQENPYPQAPEAFARQVKAVTTFDSEARLKDILAPTLIVAGDEDILTPLRFARTLKKEIPDSRLVIIEGAGHGLTRSRPQEFRQALLAFLEKNSPRPRS